MAYSNSVEVPSFFRHYQEAKMKFISKPQIRIALVLALVIAMISVGGAKAVAGLTFTTGIQIVNLESTTATITLNYYDSATGNLVATVPAAGDPAQTIAGNSSKTYYPLIGVSAGFNGSMVISSDKQIAAISNLITPDYLYGAATTSFNAGSQTFNLPLVMCNNNGFNTFFNVQNAGSNDAHITINYTPGSDGVSGSEPATIKPGAAKTFDQSVGSSTVNCSTLAGPSGKFIGSATISSDVNIVASVMQLNTTTSFRVMMGYNGIASGSTIINAPLIMANNNGFYTGIQIQNTGADPTTVTISYSPNTAGSFTPTNDTCSLAANESCTRIQNSGQWTGKYIGAATITNSAGQPLVAIVNQVSEGGGGVGPFGSSYEGFAPTSATSSVIAPLIMSNNSGFYTGIQVQNVGGSSCASVTITYGPNTALGGSFNPADEVFSLDAGASKTIIQNANFPNNGSTVNNWTGVGKYIGSADISAPGCSIVAIINEVAMNAGDNFYTYDGFNH
jgi:hypothetical protein